MRLRTVLTFGLPASLLLAIACGGDEAESAFPAPPGGEDGSVPMPPPGMFGESDAMAPTLDAALNPQALCGNGIKNEATEICDDGNTKSGDGCTSGCRIEPGWLCSAPGKACVALKCGDGLLAGDEDCDDGNTVDGDGCSATCRLERGFKCIAPNVPCVATVCGDGLKEGTEQCDDKNLDPFDGCNPLCEVEPACSGGTCVSACGDGLKFPGEGCDDGNLRSGDGCSSTCKLEPGFQCADAQGAAPQTKDLFIAYRDFLSAGAVGGHPDFMNAGQWFGLAKGLVKNDLDAQGKPDLLSSTGTGGGVVIQNATTFSSWYRDTTYSKKTVSTLRLDRQPDGTYRFASSDFFPLDTATNTYPERHAAHNSIMRNFLFTSELRIPFTYKGGEQLNFTGDDDVWVFANGKLVADIGGVKNALSDSVTLDAAKAAQLGLAVGGMYEFVVFQAERNPVRSNYTLTLTDFDRLRTSCKSVCGDGVKTPDEVCDDGAANNTGAYGKCAADCSARGPFCGDGIVQAAEGEQCDSSTDCTGDCRLKSNGPS